MGTEVSFPGLGITMNINNVAFTLFGIDVYWYGIIIASAIVLCIALGMKDCKANKFSQDLICDLILCALPTAIVGARLYYVFCEWEYYKDDLSKIIDTRSGGLAIYGGIIGAFLAVFIMCKIRKIPMAACLDFCVPYIPLGQAIGRWGNFVNQEAFGTTTTLPWGMTSADVSAYLSSNCPELDPAMPVHPTFLYESICNLFLFAILLQVRKKSKHDWETTCGYFIGYGIARFLIEGLRTDSLYLGNTGIRTSQLLSLLLVVFGVAYIAYARIKNVKRNYIPERLLNSSRILADKSSDEDSNKETSIDVTNTDVEDSKNEIETKVEETVDNEPSVDKDEIDKEE